MLSMKKIMFILCLTPAYTLQNVPSTCNYFPSHSHAFMQSTLESAREKLTAISHTEHPSPNNGILKLKINTKKKFFHIFIMEIFFLYADCVCSSLTHFHARSICINIRIALLLPFFWWWYMSEFISTTHLFMRFMIPTTNIKNAQTNTIERGSGSSMEIYKCAILCVRKDIFSRFMEILTYNPKLHTNNFHAYQHYCSSIVWMAEFCFLLRKSAKNFLAEKKEKKRFLSQWIEMLPHSMYFQPLLKEKVCDKKYSVRDEFHVQNDLWLRIFVVRGEGREGKVFHPSFNFLSWKMNSLKFVVMKTLSEVEVWNHIRSQHQQKLHSNEWKFNELKAKSVHITVNWK
jgi:hypothetical protein